MVLLDSRCLKDSNDTKFVIFGPTDDFLLILQVAAWFKGFWILFDYRKATWRNLIRRYPFGWILIVSHRIKLRLDAPDLGIPLRVSDLFWTLRSRSNEREEIWESASPRLGFRRGFR
jgi:hypothetical protein